MLRTIAGALQPANTTLASPVLASRGALEEPNHEEMVEGGTKRDRGTIRVARRVYVGNLAWKTGWQELKDYFGQVGKGKI